MKSNSYFYSKYKVFFDKIDTFIIDGNFRSALSDFYQLVVIYGLIFGKIFQLFYIVTSDKSQASYIKAFKECKSFFQLSQV